MKKLVLIFIMIMFAIPALAMEEVINVTINDSTWTEIPLNYDQNAHAYALQARTSVAFMIQKSAISTSYWTVKADGGISLTEFIPKKGGTLCYAKSSSGSIVIEVTIIQNR